MDIADRFRPISEEETAELRALASGLQPIFKAA